MARLLISAAHKSSGKTTVTLGLCAALQKNNFKVQPFKKGPDYIDPMWLALASGRPCYNLDFFTQTHDEITDLFDSKSTNADISIIEGNKGLSDGLDLDGSNSSAALAKLLNVPVIMVIDTQGITRSVAPLLLGFQEFEPDVNIAGVILNKVGGSRHEEKLRRVLQEYTDIPVLGAIQRDPSLEIVERHLGLIPSNETASAHLLIKRISENITKQIDLERLVKIAAVADRPDNAPGLKPKRTSGLTIGILRDEAFGFYYPDDLEAFEQAGASLVFIDAINDNQIAPIDGLFIGGGFPESRMKQLENNSKMRALLRDKINNGLPVYAECGGLMYLSKGIHWQDQYSEMLGVIDASSVMHDRPVGRGYVYLRKNEKHPWINGNIKGVHQQPAHEFHYSELKLNSSNNYFGFDVIRGKGIINKLDGFLINNIIATYAHQRNTLSNPWINEFLEFVSRVKKQD
ncbi:MAG: cobyrinate a,c-diamide synthase [Acidiferrobacterales bacterium]